jgi:molybdenum ABC transporter molybdate-binding protein
VEVLLRDVATLAPQPERAPYAPSPALDTEARWYAGDFHVHSRESGDASPTLDEVLDFAESRGLDLVMLSEHNMTSQLELYADVQARHPSVLLVPGIEVTTYEGHAMSIGGTTWIDHRLGVESRTMDQVVRDVHESGTLFSINHPALDLGDLCIGCGWVAMAAPEGIDAFEAQTGAYSVTGRLFYRGTTSMWEDLVLAGHHVAALGGSDDHRAGTGTGRFESLIGSPTTTVFARELSAEAILEGIRLGRTVVKLEGPEDPMVELSSADLAEDTDTVVADRTSLVVRVTGATEGGALRFVRDGIAGTPIEVVGTTFEHEELVIAGARTGAIRVELVIGGQPRVVTSHLFLDPLTPGGPDGGLVSDAGPTDGPSEDAGMSDAGPSAAASGCSCRVGGGARSSAWLAAALALVACSRLARRRRTPSWRDGSTTMHRISRTIAACALAQLAVCATGCDGSPTERHATPTSAEPERAERAEREVIVFAATSLREPFGAIEAAFESTHPGVDVTLQLAGTQELRAQIEAGAPADVFASADLRSMEALRSSGVITRSDVFARNEPVLVVAAVASERIPSFEAFPLAERIVLGVPEVPIGRYSLEILDRASTVTPDFRTNVEARVVSRELNVRQVLAKVAIGEADAGIVYRTDVRATEGVAVREIPSMLNVIAEYPIAVLHEARNPQLAAELVALVRSAQGQRALDEAGFLPPGESSQ